MNQSTKRTWISPEIRRYGTFEAATQSCTKDWGAGDSWSFQNQPTTVVCAS